MEKGDFVRIRKDIKKGKTYGFCKCTDEMFELRDTFKIVKSMDEDGNLILKSLRKPGYSSESGWWDKSMVEKLDGSKYKPYQRYIEGKI